MYKEAEQYKEIKSFFDLIEKKLSKSHTKQEYDYFLIQIRNYIESNEVFFKNPAFESEKEFRIVIEIADERVHRPKNNYAGKNNKQIEDEFTVKNGLIVPFCWLNLIVMLLLMLQFHLLQNLVLPRRV